MKFMFVILIRLYQLLIAPVIGSCCRFEPTCSHYALEAIQKHGAFKGMWLALKRISKCRPGHIGGEDPVP